MGSARRLLGGGSVCEVVAGSHGNRQTGQTRQVESVCVSGPWRISGDQFRQELIHVVCLSIPAQHETIDENRSHGM